MKTYKRLFTFGCSFTQFVWPTWADIIAHDLGIFYENWGISGTGNVCIASKILECDLKNNFCDSDLILVNWSSFHREDRIINGCWEQGGSIFNNDNYDQKFIQKFWNYDNDIVKNCSAIIWTNKIYNINYQSHMIDYEGVSENGKKIYDFSKYEFYLKNLPVKKLFDTSNNSQFNNRIDDGHPDILCHLQHVNKIYDELNIKIKPSTIEKYKILQEKVISAVDSNNRKKINKRWANTYNFIKGLNL